MKQIVERETGRGGVVADESTAMTQTVQRDFGSFAGRKVEAARRSRLVSFRVA